MDLEGQIDVLSCAVPHEFELAIWRNEGYYPVCVKLAKLDALVELAVFQCDASSSRSCSFRAGLVARWVEIVFTKGEAVIEAEFALRSARQVGAHNDLSVDI